MQNLISLVFMAAAAAIFYAGYRVGRNTRIVYAPLEDLERRGSMFYPLSKFNPLPEVPKSENVPKKQTEKEEDTNIFFK